MKQITEEEIKSESLRVLSKDGKIKRENCAPVGQITWDAFDRGFIQGAQWAISEYKASQAAPEPTYPIGGYAPGNYSCKCSTCGKIFLGDKRAVQCEPCATEAAPEQAPDLTAKEVWKEMNRSEVAKEHYHNAALKLSASHYHEIKQLKEENELLKKKLAATEQGEPLNQKFYEYGESLGIKINDLQRLMYLAKDHVRAEQGVESGKDWKEGFRNK